MSNKPSHTEEEYFAREEIEKLKRIAHDRTEKLQLTERQKLKDLHWMHCPKCGMQLDSVVYRGIEIDKCLSCQGIFLDQGELEKLIGEESTLLSSIASLFK